MAVSVNHVTQGRLMHVAVYIMPTLSIIAILCIVVTVVFELLVCFDRHRGEEKRT